MGNAICVKSQDTDAGVRGRFRQSWRTPPMERPPRRQRKRRTMARPARRRSCAPRQRSPKNSLPVSRLPRILWINQPGAVSRS